MHPTHSPDTPINLLLDAVRHALHLQSDAQLSRVLGVVPPVISKLRHQRLQVGASLLVSLHEATGWPIRDIKRWLRMPVRDPIQRQ